jgi:hypothetical protein
MVYWCGLQWPGLDDADTRCGVGRSYNGNGKGSECETRHRKREGLARAYVIAPFRPPCAYGQGCAPQLPTSSGHAASGLAISKIILRRDPWTLIVLRIPVVIIDLTPHNFPRRPGLFASASLVIARPVTPGTTTGGALAAGEDASSLFLFSSKSLVRSEKPSAASPAPTTALYSACPPVNMPVVVEPTLSHGLGAPR